MSELPDNRPLRKRPGESWRTCLLRRAAEHGIADCVASDFDHTRKWSHDTLRHDAMMIASDRGIAPEPKGPFNSWRMFMYRPRGRGTCQQCRLEKQRRMQASRRFWKHEGRAMLLQSRGGSIFGSTSDTSVSQISGTIDEDAKVWNVTWTVKLPVVYTESGE